MAGIAALPLDDDDLGTDDVEQLLRIVKQDKVGRQRLRFELREGRPFLVSGELRVVKTTHEAEPVKASRNGIGRATITEPEPEPEEETHEEDDPEEETPEDGGQLDEASATITREPAPGGHDVAPEDVDDEGAAEEPAPAPEPVKAKRAPRKTTTKPRATMISGSK